MIDEIRLVIADDHPTFCAGLRTALAESPELHVVGEAWDGATALQLIRQSLPQIAILDIHMPELTGFAIARAIQQERLPVQVILLTGDTDLEPYQAALKLGITGYLLKESATLEIVSSVKMIAAGKPYVSAALAIRFQQQQLQAAALFGAPAMQLLTHKERLILKLIAEWKASKDIAEELHMNYRTVDNHRTHISQKLGLEGDHALLRFALEHKDELF